MHAFHSDVEAALILDCPITRNGDRVIGTGPEASGSLQCDGKVCGLAF